MKTRFFAAVMAVGVILAVCPWPVFSAAEAADAPAKTDEHRLTGRWVRPDGGYVIDIRGVQDGGKLDAAYFNPNPIHVSRSEWSQDGGVLSVFVELTDRNYPGATYRLRYDPRSEQLTGEYHQPLLGETFDVSFIREPLNGQ
ncbi:MAG: hypothetical protein WC352_06295 [Candidatus Omnitrophota bacterium]